MSNFAAMIFVAVATAAIVTIPWFLFFRTWRFRFLPGTGASVLGISAVIFPGLIFTGWPLYAGGHGARPEVEHWIGFVIINTIIAVAAGIPGGCLGIVIALVMERRMSPQLGQPHNTEPERIPKDQE